MHASNEPPGQSVGVGDGLGEGVGDGLGAGPSGLVEPIAPHFTFLIV